MGLRIQVSHNSEHKHALRGFSWNIKSCLPPAQADGYNLPQTSHIQADLWNKQKEQFKCKQVEEEGDATKH